MKKLTANLVLSTILISMNAGATNYYFSSTSGDDSRSSAQVQNSTTPWKTLSKLNSFFSSLQPGDHVYFKCGDVFYGSINPTKSGTSSGSIYFGAFGTGAKPIISGLSDATGWVSLGGNIWESSAISGGQTTTMIVLIGGKSYPMGRWPNATDTWGGFRTIASHSGSTSITDASTLPSSPNWTGATIVIRKSQYIIDKGTVTSQSGNTLTYSSSYTNGDPINGYGYFIQNSPSTLNQTNEWYYNPSTKKLRIYSSSSPANVKISTINTIINLTSRSYISFNNLAIQGSIGDLISFSSSQHITFTNCDLSYAGNSAFYGSSYGSLDIEYCTISNSNNIAINVLGGANGTTIKNNIITNTGIYPGMTDQSRGTESGNGIQIYGNNTTIQNNTIKNTGYSAIDFRGSYVSIKNNLVDTFDITKDEGGGVYTFSGTSDVSRTIDGNIILNGIGAFAGKPTTLGSAAEGIYLDGQAGNVSVINNTVANIGRNGLHLTDAHDIIVRNNTIYNCIHASLYMGRTTSVGIRNITLKSNLFVMKTPDPGEGNICYYTPESSAFLFGTSDSNVVATPINDVNAWFTVTNSQTSPTYTHRTLSQWQSASGKDLHSKKSPKSISSLSYLRFEYNATSSSKAVSLGVAYLDIKGISFPSSITLAPYTSAILILASATSTQAVANTSEITDVNTLNTSKTSFTIYPNPVTDNFTLELNNSQTGKMNVQIVNASGQIVRSLFLNKDQPTTQFNLSATELPKGVYFVDVQVGNWHDIKKIVKL